MRLIQYLTFFLIGSASAVVIAQPVIHETESSYPIYGSTAMELREQMDHHGPRSNEQQFNASTVWYVKWDYSFTDDNGYCRITNSHVEVDINYQLPEWQNAQASTPELQTKWQQTFEQLRNHEQEHGKNGKKAGLAVEKAIGTFAPSENCHILQAEVDKKANQIIHFYNNEDQQLDFKTNHGIS